MSRWMVGVFLAGCRLNFDEVAPGDPSDANVDSGMLDDAAVLQCGVPLRLGAAAATATALSATVTQRRVIAGWLEGGDFHGLAFQATPVVTVDAPRTLPGPWSGVSLASDGATGLVAFGTPSGSVVRQTDDLGTLGGDPRPTSLHILGARAVIATGATPAYALVGAVDGAAGNVQIAGFSNTGVEVGTPTLLATGRARATVVSLGTELAVVAATLSNNCEIVAVANDLSAAGSLTPFGANGQCQTPLGVHAAGRGDVLLVRHDLADADLNHQIATFAGTTIAPVGEMRLVTPGDEPRGAAVSDGYWVSYVTGGQLAAVHVDFAGMEGPEQRFGAVPDGLGHDVFALAGQAYLVWLDGSGLELTRLCP